MSVLLVDHLTYYYNIHRAAKPSGKFQIKRLARLLDGEFCAGCPGHDSHL